MISLQMEQLKRVWFMKILLNSIFLLICSVSVAFGSANTDSILDIDSPPAYNAVNGAFVNYSTVTTVYLILDAKTISGSGTTAVTVQIDLKINCKTLNATNNIGNTNAILNIDSPPAYNAVDGAFILCGTIDSTYLVINCQTLTGVVDSHDVTIDSPITIKLEIEKRNTKMQWGQFITWEQGIEWNGNKGIEWKANNNAAMLAP